jgi:hypothetical protein
MEKAGIDMTEKTVVLEIDKPHFIVRLYEDTLKIDLKGSAKNEIEEALENKPILRETIGGILSMFAPLHVRLSHIDSAQMDKTGNVKLILPLHRDITIPLKLDEAKKLVDQLNRLIPIEKGKELERTMKKHRLRKIVGEERGLAEEAIASTMVPIAEPSGVIEKDKEAEEEIEEEQEKED